MGMECSRNPVGDTELLLGPIVEVISRHSRAPGASELPT